MPGGFYIREIQEALSAYQNDFRVSKNMRIFINVSSLCKFENSQPLPPHFIDNIRLPELQTKGYYPFFGQMRLNFALDNEVHSWGSLSSVPPYALVSDPNPSSDQDNLKPSTEG
jgi:hypothetical protein